MNDEALRALTERVLALERRVRNYRRAGALAVLATAVVLSIGAGRSREEVEARKFVLIGQDGTRRAWLGTEEKGSVGLVVMGKDGAQRATLGVDPLDAAGLELYGRNGEKRFGLAVEGDGAASLAYFEKGSRVRAALNMAGGQGGGIGLVLNDAEGKTRATIGVQRTGSAVIAALDESGRPLWKQP
jgi:hypothetical protein